MKLNTIANMDCLEGLKTLPDNFVDCCVTSPPYYGLRDYGHSNQIGLEKTPEEYIRKMTEVFSEVRRVLKSNGTLWLNIGDTYNAYKANTGDTKYAGMSGRPIHKKGLTTKNLKNKDLIGIPWMLAFALRADGWYLRQDIIWAKPNPMPESVTDRCTKSHEYIFLLSKSGKYFYDSYAIKTPMKGSSITRLSQDIENQAGSDRVPGKTNGTMKAVCANGITRDRLFDYNSKEKQLRPKTIRGGYNKESDVPLPEALANKRSVWTVTTKPYKEAHFATFPEDLIVDCIKAGCPENGIVLDPFMGAGTTALVAKKLNRNYVGFELNPDYITISEKRLQK
jgi:DNA modification methylase